ncbi:MAG: Membrane protein insertase YidC [Planctomycetes bacterium ADurb.Bin412]|nr:MAG: Membrane protein insertase YidC [Planctomycetes bacterium ADurb.Bin412]
MDNIDIKKLLTVSLLCLAIMLLWQSYMAKKYPQAPEQPAQPAQQTTPPPSAAPTPGTAEAPALTETVSDAWQLEKILVPENQAIVLGSRQAVLGFKAQIDLDSHAAAVRNVLLSEHKLKVTDKETGYPLLSPAYDRRQGEVLSFTLGTITLNRIFPNRQEKLTYNLSRDCWKLLPQTPAEGQQAHYVTFAAAITGPNNQTAFEILKTYRYQPGDYDLEMEISFVNKSDTPVQVESLEIIGPTGVLREDPRSDRRKAMAAFKSGTQVEIENKDLTSLFKKPQESTLLNNKNLPLCWYGSTNKFFAAIIHPVALQGDKIVTYLGKNQVENKILLRDLAGDESDINQTICSTTSLSMELPIPPNSAEAAPKFHFQIYLGPIDKDIFDLAKYKELHYEKLVNVSWCAFEWLTFALLGVMKLVYKAIGNYGIAIIILVLVVRLILHPITKKGQVSMMKMQKMGPKIEEIKKKYAGNKEEIQKKTMEIYKEQGATPILGCLPMLLQMPIWIALYTAVDANVALRHEGLFPAAWHWLTDLSAPDRLIPFSVFGVDKPIHIPLIGSLIGNIDAFNLLPILLSVGMYLQQKLTPQTSMAQTNPQMAQQQKMMLVMMPVMMLVFLYSAPSGLNLYIMASTFGGIIEQYIIRKHIRKQEALEAAGAVTPSVKLAGKMGIKKKKPKPPVKFY